MHFRVQICLCHARSFHFLARNNRLINYVIYGRLIEIARWLQINNVQKKAPCASDAEMDRPIFLFISFLSLPKEPFCLGKSGLFSHVMSRWGLLASTNKDSTENSVQTLSITISEHLPLPVA